MERGLVDAVDRLFKRYDTWFKLPEDTGNYNMPGFSGITKEAGWVEPETLKLVTVKVEKVPVEDFLQAVNIEPDELVDEIKRRNPQLNDEQANWEMDNETQISRVALKSLLRKGD